jgi:hypothetical protein
MSGISIFFTHKNFYFAVSLVLGGQMITIISRPIGRIGQNAKIIHDKDANHELTYDI